MRQYAESGIGLRGRYKNDLFFRTILNLSALSIGFASTCLFAFLVSTRLPHYSAFAFAALLIGAVGCTLLFAAIALKPVREILYYQKLFISNIAHELRTPLSTIKTSTEVALLDDTLPESTLEVHSEVLRELERISDIINNLLSLNALTRPERIEFSKIDLGPLLDQVADHLSDFAKEREVYLTLEKHKSRIVWGNATALEQIMTNIIKNAISYTPQGRGITVVVSVKPDHRGTIVFSVADRGIGIAPKDLAHIFDPFYRVDTSRDRTVLKTGSGLGLTIASELVRVHRGKITIKSVANQGTTVLVHFPSKPARYTIAPSPAEAQEQRENEITMDFSQYKKGGYF